MILPPGFECPGLNDSKQLSEKRKQPRPIIEQNAPARAVVMVDAQEIDKINILNASIEGMHRALSKLSIRPQDILVDGNRFKPYNDIPYTTVVKGDATYMSIAAASILAKTHRDELMDRLALEYHGYDWATNKGYPTKAHRAKNCHPSAPRSTASPSVSPDPPLKIQSQPLPLQIQSNS